MNPLHTSNAAPMARAFAGAGSGWQRLQCLALLQGARRRLPQAVAAAADIPASRRSGWLAEAQSPGTLPAPWLRNAATWELAALTLAHFFDLCSRQPGGQPLALPSAAADEVWHRWLDTDPDGLAAWQRRWFNREVPHREAHDLGAPLAHCLARSWVAACRSEGRHALGARLPLLFMLDAALKAPGGWHYQPGPRGIGHRDIGPQGQPQGPLRGHPELSAAGLAAMGLLTADELKAWHLRRQGADAGLSFGSTADGCADSTGGSGCGGCSCGSGCGGGGCGS